jgi:hypothetical protein
MSVQPEPFPERNDDGTLVTQPSPEVDNAQPEQAVGEVPVAADGTSEPVEQFADATPVVEDAGPEPTSEPVEATVVESVDEDLPPNFYRLPGGNVEMD